jgi:hypothetical protein
MDVRRSRVGTNVRTEGGLLPTDVLGRIADGDDGLPGLTEADYDLPQNVRFAEAITDSWNRLAGLWVSFSTILAASTSGEPLTTPTRERWLLPLLNELGFGRLGAARPVDVDGTSYPISHALDVVPLHLVGAGVELDRRTPGVRGAAGAAPHALVQDLLNRSDDRLWGIVSNGRILRVLRDSSSLTRQAYIEFDLEAIFDGASYAEFTLLWLVCHRTRFVGDGLEDIPLERWSRLAAEEGTRALDKLRSGVTGAIQELGSGFLAHPANHALREALRSGELDKQDYYRQLLRLAYRLIFLFTAEDRRDESSGRELLLDPAAPDDAVERFRDNYSTTRLRALAARRRGTRHHDLWISLRRVIAALGSDTGASTVALPPLGSFLFGPDACPDLDVAEVRNQELLTGIRALATIEENGRLRPVDYRNLGAEELGGIYESLLELHPRVEMDASPPRFDLTTAAGHERKTTGSYYTPSSLIESLLDTALDPILDEATIGKDRDEAERAILTLAVVDPAAGSGHFLVAAAHRMAKRLARVRTGEGEPPLADVRRALREVIAHCVYAVDRNPMSVELCKVSLWLEALEPGKPLSFLDAHVKLGNSLLGASVDLLEPGIPDAAYEPLVDDDKAIARAIKARNAAERRGQQTFHEATVGLPIEELAAAQRELELAGDDDLAALRAKELRHRELLESHPYRRAQLTANAWTAAFVAPKVPGSPEITSGLIRALASDPQNVPASTKELIESLASRYGFFHWEIEFPQVFARGGFDVVLGNPPWERVKLQEKEYFAERSPAVATAKNAAVRKRMIAALQSTDPDLWKAFRDELRRADGEMSIIRGAGRFPLSARGDVNTYLVFAELMAIRTLGNGRAGFIVPSGIATDDTTKTFFGHVVENSQLVSLFDFVNDRGYFPGVGHGRQRFSLVTTSAPHASPAADLAFFLHDVSDLREQPRHVRLGSEDFALFNPNTLTSPTIRNAEDADVARSVYRRIPILVREGDAEGNEWGVSFLRMFDMATDSHLFADAPGPTLRPLYEAKMAHQFNHRYGDYALRASGSMDTELPRASEQVLADPSYSVTPKYWIKEEHIDARLHNRWDRNWLIGWRDICRSSDERTLISTVLPRVAVGDKFLLMMSPEPAFPLLVANLNSFALDWQARQKLGGTSMKYYVMKQLPVLPPMVFQGDCSWSNESLAEWLRRYVVELIYTSHDLHDFAEDLGWHGAPFRYDVGRRAQLRSELDAAFLILYGHSRAEAERILESFPIVRAHEMKRWGEFRTARIVIEAMDAMTGASPDRPFVSSVVPSPGSPAATHSDPTGEARDRWVPWLEVLGRSRSSQNGSDPSSSPVQLERSALRTYDSMQAPARKAAESPAPSMEATQETLGGLIEGNFDGWLPEAAADASLISPGVKVRHRTFGQGVVSAVRADGRTTSLRVRFGSTEREIAFGYGTLEFETRRQ